MPNPLHTSDLDIHMSLYDKIVKNSIMQIDEIRLFLLIKCGNYYEM